MARRVQRFIVDLRADGDGPGGSFCPRAG
jgi:hypothetical protein